MKYSSAVRVLVCCSPNISRFDAAGATKLIASPDVAGSSLISSSSATTSPIRTALPKIAIATTTTATSFTGGPPWIPVSWTAVWPLPRAISQRLTGTVRTNAMKRANASEPQKSRSESPASIAPGMTSRIALSTTSIVAIDRVSDARAIGITTASARPARRSGRLVRA